MTVIDKPVIKKCGAKPYTKMSWITDFQRFGIEKLSDDMVAFMERRIYDIAGVTDNKVSVYFNDEKIKIKSFNDYINLYGGNKKTYEKLSERWELAVAVSTNDKFEQISFVNGIATPKGGVHVDVVSKMLTSEVVKYIKKKHKKEVPEKYVKNYLSIYLNSVIENPSFDCSNKRKIDYTQN